MVPALQAAVRQNRLPHAGLLAGGTEDDAKELAAAFNCLSAGVRPCGTCLACAKLAEGNHPDVTFFDCTQAKIDQIRALTADMQTLPNEGRHKVCVLLSADELSSVCQNALLKVLEEPPKNAAFVLTAGSPQALLPTVRSRLTVWGAGVSMPETADVGTDSILSAYDSGDELKLLTACLSRDKLTRDETGALIDALRAGLLERRSLTAAERLGELRLTLERNTGVGHICGAVAVILAENPKK